MKVGILICLNCSILSVDEAGYSAPRPLSGSYYREGGVEGGARGT
jgi:hypothetical protein